MPKGRYCCIRCVCMSFTSKDFVNQVDNQKTNYFHLFLTISLIAVASHFPYTENSISENTKRQTKQFLKFHFLKNHNSNDYHILNNVISNHY